MRFGRVLVCILLPPLAVLDRGCGAITLTTILTLVGWVPGVIAAILFNRPEKTVLVVKEKVVRRPPSKG
ncbi:MAG: YqaE/Pmp3 family membrane protein [Anaerolineales bacterium]|nr:YqaE/Pmp3 family membrane protein [Anaerolineales bacterium]